MLRNLCTTGNKERISPERDGSHFLKLLWHLNYLWVLFLLLLFYYCFVLFYSQIIKTIQKKVKNSFSLGTRCFGVLNTYWVLKQSETGKKKKDIDFEDWVNGPHGPRKDFMNCDTLIDNSNFMFLCLICIKSANIRLF